MFVPIKAYKYETAKPHTCQPSDLSSNSVNIVCFDITLLEKESSVHKMYKEDNIGNVPGTVTRRQLCIFTFPLLIIFIFEDNYGKAMALLHYVPSNNHSDETEGTLSTIRYCVV